ncbi:hypothetical protein CDO73_12480 [Saccharibacillus sp. O23]|uniref:radical SAM protein n=1 Tax=Saccharibacillus sp. O23 TaxID=2009338 RepID=UPI000B4E52CB|nr:radical SAM protein [Saccharibacillus sp. O23]OWR29894.1 hypothetical protein CDO73_12480 [Saccharibacillus sp. O23]
MRGVKFISKQNQEYFFDNDTGQILFGERNEGLENLKEKFNLSKKNNIRFLEESDLRDYLYKDGNGFKQLILEISSACNLRCTYCIYSEHYPFTRNHGTGKMPWKIAKRTIDYYFENFEIMYHRNPIRKAVISYYGGEPLTNFKILKQTVEYIEQQYSQYEVLFNITTNGLLLTPSIQKFLYEHHFSVLVSLDGYEENHDRNRLDIHGKPTFHKVFAHIQEFRANFPKASVSIAMCFDYKTDFRTLAKFVDENQLSVIHTGQVQAQNSTYYSAFTPEETAHFFDNYQIMKEEFLASAATGTIERSQFLYRFFGSIYASLAFHPMIRENSHFIRPYTGTCVPGEKLYVTIDGNFKICEKINSSFNIGNVEKGLDLKASTKILNDYNQSICTKCQECSISKLCTLCFKNFESENGFEWNQQVCTNQQNSIQALLSEFVSMLEENPKLFDEVTMDYFELLNESGECL